MSKKQGFIKGAFILLASNMVVKILGAFFKIPLTNLLGASGIGTFSIAYNIFALMFVIGSAGLPVSISKLISDQNARNQSQNNGKILRISFILFVSISAFISAFIFFFAREICNFIGNENAYLSIIAIVPAIFIVTIVSILRGYYQGHHDMTKTAISQLLEAFFKLLIGYFFARHLLDVGYDQSIAAAGAIFGVTLSTLISAIYLVCCFTFKKRKKRETPNISSINIAKKLLKLSIPITISASILSLTGLIDMVTIMNILKSSGFHESTANEFYGAYNMSMAVYSLPQTLILSISVSIIPGISEHFAKNNHKIIEKTINSGLLLATIFAFPCAIGLITLSTEILSFLYYKQPADVLIASPVLVVLAYAVVLVSLVTITNSNLQSISQQFLPLNAIFCGIFVKIATNLIFIPRMNISGAGIGTVLCFFVIAIMNLKNLSKFYKINYDKILIKPAICSIFMYFFIIFYKNNFNQNSKLFLPLIITFSAIFYFFSYFLLGGYKDLKHYFSIKFLKK